MPYSKMFMPAGNAAFKTRNYMAREHCVMSDFLTVGFILANSSFYCNNLQLCAGFIFVFSF